MQSYSGPDVLEASQEHPRAALGTSRDLPGGSGHMVLELQIEPGMNLSLLGCPFSPTISLCIKQFIIGWRDGAAGRMLALQMIYLGLNLDTPYDSLSPEHHQMWPPNQNQNKKVLIFCVAIPLGLQRHMTFSYLWWNPTYQQEIFCFYFKNSFCLLIFF